MRRLLHSYQWWVVWPCTAGVLPSGVTQGTIRVCPRNGLRFLLLPSISSSPSTMSSPLIPLLLMFELGLCHRFVAVCLSRFVTAAVGSLSCPCLVMVSLLILLTVSTTIWLRTHALWFLRIRWVPWTYFSGDVFCHGMLFTALSRARSWEHVKVFAVDCEPCILKN